MIQNWLSPIISLIAILTALWKLFELKARVDANLAELSYRLHSLQENSAHQDEVIKMSLNQVKEVAEHVRARSRLETESIEMRLTDVENWLAKNTAFERRHQ